MCCKRAKLLLTHYAVQGLDLKIRQGLARHLPKCSACKKELDRLVATVQIIQSIEEVDLPRDYVEAVHARLGKG